MKNKEQQQGRILSVEIRDVETGELLKEGLTKGIACVFVTEELTQCFVSFDGISTVDAVETLLGLQKVASAIEGDLKKQTSVETVEKIKALIKKENPESSDVEGE